jgi:hypothetical protein
MLDLSQHAARPVDRRPHRSFRLIRPFDDCDVMAWAAKPTRLSFRLYTNRMGSPMGHFSEDGGKRLTRVRRIAGQGGELVEFRKIGQFSPRCTTHFLLPKAPQTARSTMSAPITCRHIFHGDDLQMLDVPRLPKATSMRNDWIPAKSGTARSRHSAMCLMDLRTANTHLARGGQSC